MPLRSRDLVEGAQYKVIKNGVRLDWNEPVRGGYRGKSVRVPVGEILTYTGSKMGWGSDNIHQDTFRWDRKNIEGTYGPATWGAARVDGYLEPVGGRMSSEQRLLDLSMRVAAQERLAEKWIQKAIKKPGRVHEMLGIPADEDIPKSKIEEALSSVKEKIQRYKDRGHKVPENLKSEQSALNLALRFQKPL